MKTIDQLAKEKNIILTEAQRRAAETVGGPVLLLAVPGAGKTTVVVTRVAVLIAEQAVAPERILTLTFNRAAARDMATRWNTLCGEMLPDVQPRFSTIHSFCFSLLREYADARGTALPRVIHDSGVRVSALLGDFYREATGNYLTVDRLQELENAIGFAVNAQLDETARCRLDEKVDGFSAVFARYTQYKREHALMDFDDMLLFTHTLLERQPRFCETVAARYDHLIVDEAQDTSKIQYAILRLLARNNLFLVGDEDQSIYGFRGAWPQGMLDFAQQFRDAQILRIEDNFRSHSEITDPASLLIADNRARYAKSMHAVRGSGGSLRLRGELTLEQEYDAIAATLKALPQTETAAVLYRNGYTGIGLARALRRAGVDFVCRGGSTCLAADSITRDMLAIMTLADDPADTVAFRRCYFRLGCPISRGIAEAAVTAAPKDLLLSILEAADYPTKNSGRLSWTIRVLRGMAGKPPAQRLTSILGDLQYLSGLERRGQGGYLTAQAVQKLCLLTELAHKTATVAEFTAAVDAAEEVLSGTGDGRIVLSTVHAAKGQEFDRVFIADALDGIFPDSDAVEDAAAGSTAAMEEERRLFYTAMTRAKESLEIVMPADALGRTLVPSRFAARLDSRLPLIAGEPVMVGLCLAHASFGIGEVVRLDAARGRFCARFPVYGEKTFTLESLADPALFRRI